MKIFALYFRIELRQKPEWFDEFYKKYEGVNDLHVTVIQPRYVGKERIDTLKQVVSVFLDTHTLTEADKSMEFDELVYGPDENGVYLFMLNASLKNGLSRFQKELKDVLSGFETYVEEITRDYEVNFKPHITIGRNVAKDTVEEVKSYFTEPYIIAGTISELILPIVKNTGGEEVINPKNLTVFGV